MANEETAQPSGQEANLNEPEQVEEQEEVTIGQIDDDDELAATQQDLEAAQVENKQLRDQVLRAKAETENIRRRAERDVANAHKFSLERFANDLIPVVDNMERALESIRQLPEAASESVQSIAEGVELTRKVLLDALKKNGVEDIAPEGEPFDPAFHQAVSMQESPNVEPNTVLAVLQKGYILNGRVLRAAMVMVSKPAASESVDETV